MKKLLLDTNFLIYLAKYNLFHQLEDSCYEIFIPKSVMLELEKVSCNKKKKLRDREAAEIAKKIIEKWANVKKIIFLETSEKADEALINLAKSKKELIVGTMDKELRKKIKTMGNKTLVIRQKKFLMEE